MVAQARIPERDRRPVQTGGSGSPPRKSTMTSCPTRGIWIPPSWMPAQGELTPLFQVLQRMASLGIVRALGPMLAILASVAL